MLGNAVKDGAPCPPVDGVIEAAEGRGEVAGCPGNGAVREVARISPWGPPSFTVRMATRTCPGAYCMAGRRMRFDRLSPCSVTLDVLGGVASALTARVLREVPAPVGKDRFRDGANGGATRRAALADTRA